MKRSPILSQLSLSTAIIAATLFSSGANSESSGAVDVTAKVVATMDIKINQSSVDELIPGIPKSLSQVEATTSGTLGYKLSLKGKVETVSGNNTIVLENASSGSLPLDVEFRPCYETGAVTPTKEPFTFTNTGTEAKSDTNTIENVYSTVTACNDNKGEITLLVPESAGNTASVGSYTGKITFEMMDMNA